MGHKRIIVTVLAAAALFGAAISGCNREREPRLASASQRRGASLGSQPQAELAESLAVRPAEVLSASAHRMSPLRGRTARRQNRSAEQQRRRERDYAARSDFSRNYSPVPVVRSGDLARYEPLPEPVPVSDMYAARTQTYQTLSGPYYASSGSAPVYNRTSVPVQPQQYAQPVYTAPSAFISEPYTLAPSRTQPGSFEKVYAGGDGRGRPVQVHPSPELTMARAQLQGSAQPIDVPLPTPESFPAPIPELEPIRYSRAPTPVVQQPRIWQSQTWRQQLSQAPQPQQIQAVQTPQRPLPPLPSAYVWDSQPAAAPAPTATTSPVELFRTVPAMPVMTPAVQGWVASPTTAMRVFQ